MSNDIMKFAILSITCWSVCYLCLMCSPERLLAVARKIVVIPLGSFHYEPTAFRLNKAKQINKLKHLGMLFNKEKKTYSLGVVAIIQVAGLNRTTQAGNFNFGMSRLLTV